MKVRQAVALAVLSLAGTAVYATGDADDYNINSEIRNPSTVARTQVRSDVRQARAEGQLRPAGEAQSYAEAKVPQGTDRSRGEVKAEVLAARAAGDLVPAGEGVEVAAHTHPTGRFANLWSKKHGGQ
jgi:hypothetical protein